MGGSTRDVPPAAGATRLGSGTVADLQERIDVLIAFTGGIIFEMDRDGRYLGVWTNEPQLLARPPSELLGRTVEEVVGPETGEQFHRAFRTVVDTGEPTAFEYSLEVPAGRRTFSCLVRPHDPRDGGERRVTLLVRDLTDAKELEAKLLRAERLAALGLLAASVGHEIRQPLAYVFTSLDELERELAPSTAPAHTSALENLRSGARRISEIAASLDQLAVQRSTTAAIDVRRPLQAALELCARRLSSIRVHRSVADVALVLGDEGELCQVFANVILNAAQALAGRDDAAPAVSVSVTAARSGKTVQVTIADNGPGISSEHLPRIFDPFFTTKQGEGGSGLGLFVTRGLVEAHGGAMDVKSERGRGTTVIVSLRVARGAVPAAPAVRDAPQAEGASDAKGIPEPPTGVRRAVLRATEALAARRRLSVLVVDDEPRFVESLRLALEDAHDIETRTKAAEAIAILEENPTRYDVVLCDLAMPDIDGVAFYARMEAVGVADRFVLMTGGAFTSSAAEFVRRNACPRIGKPFLIERLLALLEEVTRDRTAS